MFLIVGYNLMAFANIAVILTGWGRFVGLKWDPVPLADHPALSLRGVIARIVSIKLSTMVANTLLVE